MKTTLRITFNKVRLGEQFEVHHMHQKRRCVKVPKFTKDGDEYNAVQIQPADGVGPLLLVDDDIYVAIQILKSGREWATDEGIEVRDPEGWRDEGINFNSTPIDYKTYQSLRSISTFAI